MSRPIIVEFSGLPNSGKTTLLQNIKSICNCNNVNPIIVQEPAELLPLIIPKGSVEQNLWITLETLQRNLELKYESNADFILLDRGFYNQLFWAKMYEEEHPKYCQYVTDLILKFDEMNDVKPDFLYIIDVSVEESIRRRLSSNKPVTFSKEQFLVSYTKKFEEFYKTIESKLYLDTTNLSKSEVAETVFKTIIAL